MEDYNMNWSDFWDALFKFLPYLITAGISYYAIRHTGKMKELELKDKKRGRIFQIQKKVTDLSIDSLWKAHFVLEQQIPAVIEIIRGEDNIDKNTMEGIQKAHEFINSHAIYFPLEIRENLRSISHRLNNIAKYKDNIDHDTKIDVFEETLSIIEKAKKALEDYIDKFNMLNYKL